MFGFIKFSKPIKPFGRSCLNGLCVWLKPDRIYSFEATSTVQPPRSRSSTGKTKKSKKNWNSIVLQRFEPPGFILRRSIEFQWFFAESPCELRFWVVFWHLIGVWVRGFSSALADDFFFRGWPPVVFFLIEKAAAFFFEFRFVAIIKNRPVRGGFLLQLNLCGPNSTLCRWYRTFFEILFQKCVVPDLFEILRRVPAW